LENVTRDDIVLAAQTIRPVTERSRILWIGINVAWHIGDTICPKLSSGDLVYFAGFCLSSSSRLCDADSILEISDKSNFSVDDWTLEQILIGAPERYIHSPRSLLDYRVYHATGYGNESITLGLTTNVLQQ